MEETTQRGSRRRILRELQRIAFLDPKDYVSRAATAAESGEGLREVSELPLRARRAIEAIAQTREGRLTYKFYSKLKALEMLEKMESQQEQGTAMRLEEGDRLLLEKVVRRIEHSETQQCPGQEPGG